ncbi:MAG: Lsm family RNA-binding protein [Candidatus Thorarchaeota archaeon]
MSDVAAMRSFNRELASVVGATIEVATKDGKSYSGILKGIDQNTLSIVMTEVVDMKDNSSIAKILISIEGLAKELEKTFPPGGVRFFPETGVIVVMNKIRITPEGVDGSGPLYERVAAIADDWLKEHGLA